MTVLAMRVTIYAPEGRPTRWTLAERGVGPGELAVALLLSAWPLVLLPPAMAAAGMLGAGIGAATVIALARRRVGGHTGDVLGAVEQLGELGFLLGASAAVACA
jgi:adenosylcobinamide-GDP ribazoletransferase